MHHYEDLMRADGTIQTRIRFKCANCKYFFDWRKWEQEGEVRCPYCNSNAVDKINP